MTENNEKTYEERLTEAQVEATAANRDLEREIEGFAQALRARADRDAVLVLLKRLSAARNRNLTAGSRLWRVATEPMTPDQIERLTQETIGMILRALGKTGREAQARGQAQTTQRG